MIIADPRPTNEKYAPPRTVRAGDAVSDLGRYITLMPSQDPNPLDIRKPPGRATWFDWVLALLVPAIILGGYLYLQLHTWNRVVYWSHWPFAIFAGIVIVLPPAVMGCRPMVIRARRVVLLLLVLIGLPLAFHLCWPSIGFVHEFAEFNAVGHFSLLFPADEGQKKNWDGNYVSPWGTHRETFKRVMISRFNGTRTFIFKHIELIKGEPEHEQDLLDWMARHTGASNHEETSRKKFALGRHQAMRISTKWTSGNVSRSRQEILVVVSGKRGYCLMVQDDNELGQSAEVQRYFDSFQLHK